MKADPRSNSPGPTGPDPDPGWRRAVTVPSLPEAFATIPVEGRHWVRKLLAFAGPGLLVAVGYMDPGNWETDLAGGARFGYTLLSVVLISNFMAILLQHLALKLGIVAGRDLAQACRDHYSPPVAITLWVLCEIAIAACDLAEVIGSAVALNLLFRLPLEYGVLLTACDVLVVLLLQNRSFRSIEAVVVTLILLIGSCFAYELGLARPPAAELLAGLVPTPEIVRDPSMLYVAVGILGATVMPHNLYLHSSIVQTRAFDRTESGKAMAIRFASIDSTAALLFAFFINAAILVLASRVFHGTEHESAIGISNAYELLSPVLNNHWASVVFAVALLASGQNSTLTGTMAGQIVMEGFLHLRLRPWVRRLLTRLVAIVPAVVVAHFSGTDGIHKLLLLSQVILSLQLSFAVVPLIWFTSDRAKMGRFVNAPWLIALSGIVAVLIMGLNGWLVWNGVFGDGA
ncbi:MAG TPA: Nramp family divalent metal transporter [Pirellulales bacterium]|nr:Nramp family divalent metal transporter [Pirellulales bacterium]